MCEPVSLIVAIASAAFSATEARTNRSRAEKFRKNREELERQNALQAQALSTEAIHAQQLADVDTAAVEIESNRRAAESAMATATTIAGEVGAFGLSYQGLIGEFARQQAEYEGAVETNLAVKNQIAQLNIRSSEISTQARFINAAQMSAPRVNYANYALQGISTYFMVEKGTRDSSWRSG